MGEPTPKWQVGVLKDKSYYRARRAHKADCYVWHDLPALVGAEIEQAFGQDRFGGTLPEAGNMRLCISGQLYGSADLLSSTFTPAKEGQYGPGTGPADRWGMRMPMPLRRVPTRIGALFALGRPWTLVELEYHKLAGAMRDKPGWERKVADAEVAGRWRSEALDQGVSEAAVDRALAENRWLAAQPAGPRPAAAVGVFVIDEALRESVHNALLEGFERLRDVPEQLKDWHPGSKKQVLNLVHPSLHCYRCGVTHVVAEVDSRPPACASTPADPWERFASLGAPKRIDRRVLYVDGSSSYHSFTKNWWGGQYYSGEKPPPDAYSRSMQGLAWLPAEFVLQEDGSCNVASYINGLHPALHPQLYGAVGMAFAQLAPLLEAALNNFIDPPPRVVKAQEDAGGSWLGYAHHWHFTAMEPDCDANSEAWEEWDNSKVFVAPSLTPFQEPPQLPSPSQLQLRGRRLQVVVKLSSIELTPERPHYNGGDWHVEGMVDDAIVATAIYYLSNDNVEPAHLRFRERVDAPNYVQNDEDGVRLLYGLEDEKPLVQELGACTTHAQRAIAWTNNMEHRVEPFKLVNPDKPGRRQVLVFFLVDPHLRIPSSADVPPQQMEWLEMAIANIEPFKELPTECLQRILRYVRETDDSSEDSSDDSSDDSSGCHFISLSQARKRRKQLMVERSYFRRKATDEWFERPFALCEH